MFSSVWNKTVPSGRFPDGQTLIYTNEADGYILWLLLLSGLRSIPFIAAERNQTFAQFSQNGSWLAYDSHEGGHTRSLRNPISFGARQMAGVPARRHHADVAARRARNLLSEP